MRRDDIVVDNVRLLIGLFYGQKTFSGWLKVNVGSWMPTQQQLSAIVRGKAYLSTHALRCIERVLGLPDDLLSTVSLRKFRESKVWQVLHRMNKPQGQQAS